MVLSTADLDMINEDLAPNAEIAVKEYLGYDVEQATYTEYYPITDQRVPSASLDTVYAWNDSYDANMTTLIMDPISEIFVKQYPLRSIASIYQNPAAWITDPVNGDWSSQWLVAPGTGWTVDWDEPGPVPQPGPSAVAAAGPHRADRCRSTYTAGFTQPELQTVRWAAFKEACMETVKVWYLSESSLRATPTAGGSFGYITSETVRDVASRLRREVDARDWPQSLGAEQGEGDAPAPLVGEQVVEPMSLRAVNSVDSIQVMTFIPKPGRAMGVSGTWKVKRTLKCRVVPFVSAMNTNPA